MNSSSIALEAQDLSKRYGAIRALDRIDLEVPTGTITGLVGPNAAGKSTLIKVWLGFERPSSGAARVGGRDPQRARIETTSRIGYIPQVPALYRELTVADHVDLAAHLRTGFDPTVARGRLADLDIDVRRRVGSLSGGEAAQVGLALALGTRSPILLLDEPLASLDPLARRDFIDVLLATARADGTTVVISSHVVGDIELACDRLVVLGVGRKLLDTPIATAIQEHRVWNGTPPSIPGADVVAEIPSGQATRWLVRRSASAADDRETDKATLEQIVLGYLRSGRTAREDPG